MTSAGVTDLDRRIEAVLDDADRMFLATSVDGNSSGASVFFARDGSDLVFFTFSPSRKAEQIRFNPRVQAVVWARAQTDIRGLQIEGECRRITDAGEMRRARDAITGVTRDFQAYMDDPYLQKHGIVGYYRLQPTTIKHVDFRAEPQFEWREFPENEPEPLAAWGRAAASRALLWLRAVRAPFFTATAVPVLLGAVIAYADLSAAGRPSLWSWEIFWFALAGALLAHAGTNLANDFGDHTTRNDELNRAFSPFNGGSRIIQAGLMAPWKVLFAAAACFAGAVAIGLRLNHLISGSVFAATPLLWVGVLGCVLGLGYTLAPLRLGYRGLGEIAIGLGFGPVMVLGMHYVLTAGRVSPWSWAEPLAASIPVAFLVVAIVWINQFQDVPADARVGKRNWVVRLAGGDGSRIGYERPLRVFQAINFAGFAVVSALGLLGLASGAVGTPFALLALAPAPAVVFALRRARAWIIAWNAADADRARLPYELLAVNATTIAVHLATGLLLVAAYWLEIVVS